jgi:hypothetical protein
VAEVEDSDGKWIDEGDDCICDALAVVVVVVAVE